jgi:hypothetical protein
MPAVSVVGTPSHPTKFLEENPRAIAPNPTMTNIHNLGMTDTEYAKLIVLRQRLAEPGRD